MSASPESTELTLRVVVVAPPRGVSYSQHSKQHEVLNPHVSTGKDLMFTFAVRVVESAGQPLNILGPMVMGPKEQRFLYLCVGTSAGQADSPWTRRVKIQLGSISPALLAKMRKAKSTTLEARYNGVGRDGTPACATVPLLDGWQVSA